MTTRPIVHRIHLRSFGAASSKELYARKGWHALNPIRYESFHTHHTHTRPQLCCSHRYLAGNTLRRDARRHASSVDSAIVRIDGCNPPKTTLPPALGDVERGNTNIFAYLWKVARAYGSFYKSGGKAIFTNRGLATEVRERLKQKTHAQSGYDPFDTQLLASAIKADVVSRSDFQLLRRHGHDFARLPLFGVLIVIMGEWLPLIVPFMPYAVPLTCRIPSQVAGMRRLVEERRRTTFRQGIEAPSTEQIQQVVNTEDTNWPLLDLSQAQKAVTVLRDEQLWYLSSVLNLHSVVWERVQQRPPSWMIRRRLAKKLHYLAQDDRLLVRHGNAATTLAEDELLIACEERGLDVLGPSPKQLEQQLAGWLRRQAEDKARGGVTLHMLFRRPNAW